MKLSSPKQWQIFLVLAVGIVAVSMAAIFVRFCQQEAQNTTVAFSLFIAFARLAIASIFLLPTYPRLASSSLKGMYWAMGAGICLALHFATWISSLGFTSVTASVAIVTTNPLWVALLSWWFRSEVLSRRQWWGIIVALVGSVIVAGGGNSVNVVGENPLLGAILALMGSWFASGYLLLGTEAQKQGLSTGNYIIIAYLTGALFLAPFPFLFGVSYGGYSGNVYFYLILMAVISQVIGHTSFNWSLRYLSPTMVAIIILLEPVVSSFLAFLLFAEIPTVTVGGGALIILMGVMISLKK